MSKPIFYFLYLTRKAAQTGISHCITSDALSVVVVLYEKNCSACVDKLMIQLLVLNLTINGQHAVTESMGDLCFREKKIGEEIASRSRFNR